MSQNFSVSIIIPTYNRSHFIRKAIDSCLNQKHLPLPVEVLVVDDGSSDDTQPQLNSYGEQIRVLSLKTNVGRNRARNLGLEKATGRFLKFLDSDDYLEPDTLSKELQIAEEQSADIVISGMRTVKSNPNGDCTVLSTHAPPQMEPLIDSLLAGKAVTTSAALYRRSYISSLRWNETLFKLDDWEWFIRACLLGGRIAPAMHCSYSWCQHDGQGIHCASMLHNAKEHHAILTTLERHLNSSGDLTNARRERLAQYYYKELRVLCVHDRLAFDSAASHILQLSPRFRPIDEEPQRLMRLFCRAVGFRRALVWHTAAKRIFRCVSNTGQPTQK